MTLMGAFSHKQCCVKKIALMRYPVFTIFLLFNVNIGFSPLAGRAYWGTNRKIKAVQTVDWVNLRRKKLNLPTLQVSSSSTSDSDSVTSKQDGTSKPSLYSLSTKLSKNLW